MPNSVQENLDDYDAPWTDLHTLSPSNRYGHVRSPDIPRSVIPTSNISGSACTNRVTLTFQAS
ncbi:uncharacterized protein SETTUDRAFT_154235 [Exserohilum turcica Et28A]|uniref:Uncharacterized protein n=1 Tax=Exserohilum turcicum (strain 28A) TaxID=671987 RepID=R0JU48_EXST2|nr:uncharacterized protein SETTUDRAFT_154235 [Exserohilum turcica Et28A]EOA84558.1 hypothetical protein SETTUDRAFT_154235 [Exserohilum turcica Et28A]